jgi:hypothetical protein
MQIIRTPRTGLLAGFTGTAADLNAISGDATDATFVVAAENANVVECAITLKNSAGAAVGEKVGVQVWLSDTAGAAPTATAPSVGTVVTVGQTTKVVTTGTVLELVSTAAGLITLTAEHSGAKTGYWNVRLPNGKIKSSAVNTWGA